MEVLRTKALSLGATEFGPSKCKNKRFYVRYDNKIINFGLKNGSTFIDHHDTTKRKNWIARHSKIKNKEGKNNKILKIHQLRKTIIIYNIC